MPGLHIALTCATIGSPFLLYHLSLSLSWSHCLTFSPWTGIPISSLCHRVHALPRVPLSRVVLFYSTVSPLFSDFRCLLFLDCMVTVLAIKWWNVKDAWRLSRYSDSKETSQFYAQFRPWISSNLSFMYWALILTDFSSLWSSKFS
jgi:hypothetical protein